MSMFQQIKVSNIVLKLAKIFEELTELDSDEIKIIVRHFNDALRAIRMEKMGKVENRKSVLLKELVKLPIYDSKVKGLVDELHEILSKEEVYSDKKIDSLYSLHDSLHFYN